MPLPNHAPLGRPRKPFRDDELVRVELQIPGAELKRLYGLAHRYRRSLSSVMLEALADFEQRQG